MLSKTALALTLAVLLGGSDFGIVHAQQQQQQAASSASLKALETTSNCSHDCAEMVQDLLGQNVDVDDACDQVCVGAPSVKGCKGKCVGGVKRGIFFSEVCTSICGGGFLRGRGGILYT